jgi:hypothetical protein
MSMKRLQSSYVQAPPARRLLKIFASDPMAGRTAVNRVTIEINNEINLSPGPSGDRLEVVDYDGAHNRFYASVNLNEPNILMQNGLDPSESDPRFHQQMVYAVAMKTLENFDTALGRPLAMNRNSSKLRLFPHALHGANAFYDPDLHAILFGYFRADRENPGPNLPGGNIFTCLSHDIIVHEMTHAIVHRLRRYFLEPSNRDVIAFHEGFADIIALLQHFSFTDLLREEIQKTRSDIRNRGMLVQMARQFGFATGKGQELRSGLDEKPDPKLYTTEMEPHRRGSIMVAAVFDAFFTIYQKRTRDLIRIATGGSGELPAGDLHPDLVRRIADEASRTAQTLLTMCIRAFEYLPPVDITFGDYLRALVTADYELFPDDEFGRRSAMIEGFRLRGILPQNVHSLAEESLLWEESADEGPDAVPVLPVKDPKIVQWIMTSTEKVSRQAWRKKTQSINRYEETEAEVDAVEEQEMPSSELFKLLYDWAKSNAAKLALDPTKPIRVVSPHTAYRVTPDGSLLIELIVHFVQHDPAKKEGLGGLPLRGGTTVIASLDGTVRYVIAKPLPSDQLKPELKKHADVREKEQRAFLAAVDARDAQLPYMSQKTMAERMRLRMNFASLHGGV